MKVEFARTAEDYARHRAGFPDSFYDSLQNLGVVLDGRRLLDMGTGTGTLARGFAARGASVTAIDPASQMLDQARRLAEAQGCDIEFRNARAEQTGLPDASFDIIAAGQCWHWFERPRAAAECFRLLAPGGFLVIAHYDWIPLPGNVLEMTENLIREHNPNWKNHGGTGVYPRWFADASGAGFADIECHIYDEPASYSHAAWRGRVRASAGIAASLAAPEVEKFDLAHKAALAAQFSGDPLLVPHRVFILRARKPDPERATPA